jgi:polyisoprenoid-binding protein YceI
MMIEKRIILLLVISITSFRLFAADYKIDPSHSFVTFRIQHLGYSWLYGQFRDISGRFTYDSDDPEASSISVRISAASLDTNHTERDKHLRSADFLDVENFAEIRFESTQYIGTDAEGIMAGNLTLHGVTKEIKIKVFKVGQGRDPWFGYRAGFRGTYTLTRADFGMFYNLGRDSKTMEVELSIEGIRQ